MNNITGHSIRTEMDTRPPARPYNGMNLQELINARNEMEANENANKGFLTLCIALMASMYARIRN